MKKEVERATLELVTEGYRPQNVRNDPRWYYFQGMDRMFTAFSQALQHKDEIVHFYGKWFDDVVMPWGKDDEPLPNDCKTWGNGFPVPPEFKSRKDHD